MSTTSLLEAGAKSENEVTATIEYGFTLKRVHDMTRTVKCIVQISTQNTAQSFSQFGQMVECLFKNEVVLGSSPVADKDDNVSFYYSGGFLIFLSLSLKIMMEILNDFLRVGNILTFFISVV